MNSTNRPFKIIAVLFAMIVIGLGITVLVKNWHQKQMDLNQQRTESECLEVIQELESELDETRAKIESMKKEEPGNDVFEVVFGPESLDSQVDDQVVDCNKTEAQMASLYSHMDRQPYMEKYELDGGSAAFFQECASLIMAKPPVNIAEMEDLYRIVKNVTHFYRVLGKKRLMLVKEIFTHENQIIEPSMAMFFSRVVECSRPLSVGGQPLPIERLYDYAGYFLNTLGGRSYLLRRGSTVRMLMNYYAILIVDRANDGKFNQYGIDIRPYLDYLFYDVSNQKGLVYRDRYLARLTALRNKYM